MNNPKTNNNIRDMNNSKTNSMNKTLKSIILLVAVSFLGIVLFLVSYNEKALTSKTVLYSMTDRKSVV